MASEQAPRRERGMAEKNRRILSAASDLFMRNGYAAVTTQQIAERADVAAGTVFRYADSKAELLIAVFNTLLADAIERGSAAAASVSGPVEQIAAQLDPVLDAAALRPRDTAVYQRELMFGDRDGRYRREGIAIITDLEERIARLIDPAGVDGGAQLASRSIFAATHFHLVQPSLGLDASALAARALLHAQIAQIVAGAQTTGGHPAGTSSRTHEGGTPPERDNHE